MSWAGTYILDGKVPVPCKDTLEWARWMQQNDAARRVAHNQIGDCEVSTIFLGVDHSFLGRTPILFETMAFGPWAVGNWNGKPYNYRPAICSMNRYVRWDEAEAGHRFIVAEVDNYLIDTSALAEEAIMAIAEKAQ